MTVSGPVSEDHLAKRVRSFATLQFVGESSTEPGHARFGGHA